jgi:hypothetical protein
MNVTAPDAPPLGNGLHEELQRFYHDEVADCSRGPI